MATVFVIDDEESYRRYLSACLAREGHDVQVAAGAEEGIALGASTQPQILVVDWMLDQEASGLRVAAELQRRHPALRTILITGFSAGALANADDFVVFRCLEKPFELDELVDAVRDALADAQGEPAPG